jgi:hypothetical protein
VRFFKWIWAWLVRSKPPRELRAGDVSSWIARDIGVEFDSDKSIIAKVVKEEQ